MNVLTIDTGGTHVKILASGKKRHRELPSGPTFTAKRMVSAVRKLAGDWQYDAVSIGYPGLVVHGRPVLEPHNLGPGWVGFDFAAAFKLPVKVINDAAMQALGSYKGGKMLFLGLGTGLGSAMIVDGVVVPMELAHLPYKKGTYEDYVGLRGLKKHGNKRWQRHVVDVVKRLVAALEPSDVVLGGGNVNRLRKLPAGCRGGDNANAFIGGFRLWENGDGAQRSFEEVTTRQVSRAKQRAVRVVFFFDVDNTLLDNDRVAADLKDYLIREVGQERQSRYWAIFEALRVELGYADYLGALQRYRVEHPHDPHLLAVSSYLVNYPFANRLLPRSLDAIEHVSKWGPTVIFSDGDVVFQPRKVERAGLFEAVAGRVLIYIHKENELDDVVRRYPADHYVMVDDKIRILTAVKKAWGKRLTTVFVRQGRYAQAADVADYPPASITIECIGDLLNYDLSMLLEAAPVVLGRTM